MAASWNPAGRCRSSYDAGLGMTDRCARPARHRGEHGPGPLAAVGDTVYDDSGMPGTVEAVTFTTSWRYRVRWQSGALASIGDGVLSSG